MLLIRFENYPDNLEWSRFHPDRVRRLAAALLTVCVDAGIPGIDCAEKIIVVAGGQQLITNNRLVILVDALSDVPLRSQEVAERLGTELMAAARRFLNDGVSTPNWGVIVKLKRPDAQDDVYAVLHPAPTEQKQRRPAREPVPTSPREHPISVAPKSPF